MEITNKKFHFFLLVLKTKRQWAVYSSGLGIKRNTSVVCMLLCETICFLHIALSFLPYLNMLLCRAFHKGALSRQLVSFFTAIDHDFQTFVTQTHNLNAPVLPSNYHKVMKRNRNKPIKTFYVSQWHGVRARMLIAYLGMLLFFLHVSSSIHFGHFRTRDTVASCNSWFYCQHTNAIYWIFLIAKYCHIFILISMFRYPSVSIIFVNQY